MKIAFLFILLIYLLANVYVFHRIWTAMPPNLVMRIVLIALAFILTSSFFITFTIGDSLPVALTSVLYTIGSSWMFIIIYFVLAFVALDLLILANKLLGITPKGVFDQSSRESWTTMLFTFAFIALLMIGGYLRYTSKQRVYLPIEIDKPIGDSTCIQPLKIVAISDLHLGYTIGRSELEGWVDLINNENPDLILIAGDIVDNSLRPVEKENMTEVLSRLKAEKGVYACLGNHEYIGRVVQNRSQLSFFERAGIKLLRDEVVEIDSCLYVIGRDDRSNKRRKEISDLIKDLDSSKPMILLDHQPYDLSKVEENGIDLQLSGHTHKGQVWPISVITKWMYEIDHGYLQKGNSHIYVSSGIGLWGGKFRIGTQSEYVVIELKQKGK